MVCFARLVVFVDFDFLMKFWVWFLLPLIGGARVAKYRVAVSQSNLKL